MPILQQWMHEPDMIRRVKGATISELEEVSQEIRELFLQVIQQNGGHLASNMGVVELTLALYRVFDFPDPDVLVWDTGHQCYTHKILTGRAKDFSTLRTLGGISGFTRREESRYDSFGAGHVGTSIAAALGVEQAQRLQKKRGNVIAVIGDGALTSGSALEALNQASNLKSQLRVIVNDNGMSISENVGSLARSFSLLRTNPSYTGLKKGIKGLLLHAHLETLENTLEKFRDGVRSTLLPQSIFEGMGFKYIGPVDGHDLDLLTRIFENLKRDFEKPVVVHVHTKKGKGPDWVEKAPQKYHGIGPRVVPQTRPSVATPSVRVSFSEVLGETLCELAADDPRLVVLTAAMEHGTGLVRFREKFPDRFFDLGITEPFCTTFAGALATQGLHPVFGVYSTFQQRAYDQLIHDVALQRLPVVFCLDRAGIVGEDGPTHHGAFDLAYSLSIPGAHVFAPFDLVDFARILRFHGENWPEQGPVFIRYPRITQNLPPDWSEQLFCQPVAKSETFLTYEHPPLSEAPRHFLVAVGTMLAVARQAASHFPFPVGVIGIDRVKPLALEPLLRFFPPQQPVCLAFLEEGMVTGGVGAELLRQCMQRAPGMLQDFVCLGIPDVFVEHGERKRLLEKYGLDVASVVRHLRSRWEVEEKEENLVQHIDLRRGRNPD